MPPLNQFIDRLVDEKGLTNLEPATLTELKRDLVGRLENRINATLVAHLPPEKLTEFERLVDSGTPEQNQQFIQTNIPHVDQVIAEELLAFRATYLNL